MADDDKKLYLVKSRIDHDKRYEAGDFIHLTDKEAEPLLNAKVVEPHETDDDPSDADENLASMTKAQLVELAAKHDLTFPNNTTKDTIAAAIAEARAAQK